MNKSISYIQKSFLKSVANKRLYESEDHYTMLPSPARQSLTIKTVQIGSEKEQKPFEVQSERVK